MLLTVDHTVLVWILHRLKLFSLITLLTISLLHQITRLLPTLLRQMTNQLIYILVMVKMVKISN
nr:MAG TPA: hypothetical protein [Caudoviricetes sp.]